MDTQSVSATTFRIPQTEAEDKPELASQPFEAISGKREIIPGSSEVSFRVTRDPNASVMRKTVAGPRREFGTTSVEVAISHCSASFGALRVHEVAEGNHMDRNAPNYYADDLLRFSFTVQDRGAEVLRNFARAL
jgi:hypothetical protein